MDSIRLEADGQQPLPLVRGSVMFLGTTEDYHPLLITPKPPQLRCANKCD